MGQNAYPEGRKVTDDADYGDAGDDADDGDDSDDGDDGDDADDADTSRLVFLSFFICPEIRGSAFFSCQLSFRFFYFGLLDIAPPFPLICFRGRRQLPQAG